MKLVITKTYVKQLFYNTAGTLIYEKYDPTTNIKNFDVSYTDDGGFILFDVCDYPPKEAKRRIGYKDIELYSTDGTTFVTPPALATIVATLQTNIIAEAEAP